MLTRFSLAKTLLQSYDFVAIAYETLSLNYNGEFNLGICLRFFFFSFVFLTCIFRL